LKTCLDEVLCCLL